MDAGLGPGATVTLGRGPRRGQTVAWQPTPIPGAPEGKIERRPCDHTGPFQLVKAFHGTQLWQCLTCRRVSEVETRTVKTCVVCGQPLIGKQRRWCGDSDCPSAHIAAKDRVGWAQTVKRRDDYTCQGCGYRETQETKAAYNQVWLAVCREHNGKPLTPQKAHQLTMERSGTRQLEAHHKVPLEWGGPEFDLTNGITLCNLCHDEEHRRLNAEGLVLHHHCMECGHAGEVTVTSRRVVCPGCGVVNDWWMAGEIPPPNHRGQDGGSNTTCLSSSASSES